MKYIKVSVVVPIFNVEPYLSECLDSLERQTFKNFEVIMINDGSTDNSGSIAGKYEARNDNFYLIERKNGGLSSARNAGILNARGKYIYFLDSDDYIVDTALETLYEKAEAGNLDVLLFSGYVFDGFSKDMQWKTENGYKYRGSYRGIYKGTDLLRELIDNNDKDLTSCCMIFSKIDNIRKYELKFPEGIINEDNLFFLLLISVSEKTEVLNIPLYCRRRRQDSITYKIDHRLKLRSMLKSVREAEEFYAQNEEFHKESVEQYIGRFLIIMMSCWKEMSLKLQRDEEIRHIYAEMRTIAKSYDYFNNRKIQLFVMSRLLVSIYAFLYRLRRVKK